MPTKPHIVPTTNSKVALETTIVNVCGKAKQTNDTIDWILRLTTVTPQSNVHTFQVIISEAKTHFLSHAPGSGHITLVVVKSVANPKMSMQRLSRRWMTNLLHCLGGTHSTAKRWSCQPSLPKKEKGLSAPRIFRGELLLCRKSAHRIYVWYIYLHLSEILAKCR